EPVAQHLPGYDIGMVLEIADYDLVAGFQMRRTPALGDEVDRLGGAAHEHDLALVGGVQKRARLFPRLLEKVRRAAAQRVHAAMHIGVVVPIKIREAVDDAARLLRTGAGIEEHQAGIRLENRELAPQPAAIEPLGPRLGALQRYCRHLTPPDRPAGAPDAAADAYGSRGPRPFPPPRAESRRSASAATPFISSLLCPPGTRWSIAVTMFTSSLPVAM